MKSFALLLTPLAVVSISACGQAREPSMNGHIVLLGDSIFDNQAYVGRNPDVVRQLRAELPQGWTATLLAVDGSTTIDVASQLDNLPSDATHLVLSVGGNDALIAANLLQQPVRSVGEGLVALEEVRREFAKNYAAAVDAARAKKLPLIICTVYDPNFEDEGQQAAARAGLTLFNDEILRTAVREGIPVLDLRLLFSDRADYANPIEPSPQGGRKLSRAISAAFAGSSHEERQYLLYPGDSSKP